MRSRSTFSRYKREASAGLAYALLLLIVGVIAPSFFNAGNVRDLAMNNAAVLIVAVGMTLVILVGQIDISVGSQFAVCTIAAGWLAKAGLPMPAVLLAVIVTGALMGAVGGCPGRLVAHAVDCRDAGVDGGLARRTALDHRGRVDPKPAGRFSMVWTGTDVRPTADHRAR